MRMYVFPFSVDLNSVFALNVCIGFVIMFETYTQICTRATRCSCKQQNIMFALNWSQVQQIAIGTDGDGVAVVLPYRETFSQTDTYTHTPCFVNRITRFYCFAVSLLFVFECCHVFEFGFILHKIVENSTFSIVCKWIFVYYIDIVSS